MVLRERRTQQLVAFVLVRRASHADIRYAAQVGHVVGTSVGSTVGTDQARAVQCKHDRQVLARHVMDQLVIRALQKRRVDRHDWLEAFRRQTTGEGDGVLLSNANIKITFREALFKLHHT